MSRLGPLAAALLSLLPAAAAAQPIAAHPLELRFSERPWAPPRAEAFRHVLTNGVVVYLVPDHSLPLAQVAVALRAGSYLEPAEKTGLAGLTASMLRRGGTEGLSPAELDQRLDALAAEMDAAAGGIRAGASLDVPSWALEEALSLFFEALRHPRFDPERLAQAKRNLAEGLRGRNDEPGELAEREWGWLLSGLDHFSRRPLRPQNLESITREDLQAFHQRYWQPAAMVVAVSGDVEPEPFLALLEKLFAGWLVGEKAPWPPPAPAFEPRPGAYRIERDLPQARVLLGSLGPRRGGWDDPQVPAWMVLGELLGGRGARIAGSLRNAQGLVYRAGASLTIGDLWPGELRVQFEAENGNVARAAELALAEFDRLRREPPSSAELAFVKKAMVDALPYLFDSAEKTAGYFAEDDYLGRPHRFWQDYRPRIEAVSQEDVRRAARELLLPDRLLLLAVGRGREIEAAGEGQRGLLSVFPLPWTPLPERDPVTFEPLRR